MKYIEQEFYIECPHCGMEDWISCDFNTSEGDIGGINSGIKEIICQDCDVKFWYKARLNFEIDKEVYIKKPKIVKKEKLNENNPPNS